MQKRFRHKDLGCVRESTPKHESKITVIEIALAKARRGVVDNPRLGQYLGFHCGLCS